MYPLCHTDTHTCTRCVAVHVSQSLHNITTVSYIKADVCACVAYVSPEVPQHPGHMHTTIQQLPPLACTIIHEILHNNIVYNMSIVSSVLLHVGPVGLQYRIYMYFDLEIQNLMSYSNLCPPIILCFAWGEYLLA